MYLKILLVSFFAFIFQQDIFSQSCTALGQNPGTAFPVCGTNVFTQNTVPICGSNVIPTPCGIGNGIVYLDKNPYWYKFTCYASGTLGFTITPNNIGDDYDWQLFDVTGHNPNDVYIDASLFVSCNWSGRTGITGASSSGSGSVNCGGSGFPLFSQMPSLVLGHNYVLLVSHFDNSQSGYQLAFGGGTASLIDPTPARLQYASINCDGSMLAIKLTKKVQCTSLALNGSDFIISNGGSVASAVGNGCSSGFDVDSITLFLSTPLPPGNYTVTAATGTDGNTLLDNCGVSLPAGDKINFTFTALQPTAMDSISPVKCSPSIVHLIFKKPIRCNSIAPDGSDFNVTGPSAVVVTSANGICNGTGVTSSIDVQLANKIQLGGIYQIHLKSGTDGNTLIDECGQQSLASLLNFKVTDTVSALFNYQVNSSCHFDTIKFSNAGANGITEWNWTVNGNLFSIQQNPVRLFSASGQYPVKLFVSNGICTDSSVTTIVLDNEIKVGFETNDVVCPEDSVVIKNKSTGKINSWLWNFGNGITSTQQMPPSQKYPLTGREAYYTILLKAFGDNGCADSTAKKIRVLKSCFIGVPNAFTPNDDGLNDFFSPENALKADDFDFRVYNRWGQVVFKTNDWTKKWDGKIKDLPQPAGVYAWTLRYTHHDTGKKYSLKGTVLLIR